MSSTPQHITVIIDESGSMFEMGDEPIVALNSFINEQKALNIPGSTLSLRTFSDVVTTHIKNSPLETFEEFTEFIPVGRTALYDAIGNAISEKLSSETPKNVVCVIITDGQDNASEKFSREEAKKLITKAEIDYNWKFIYMAANQDAFSVGNTFGVKNCINFSTCAGGITMAASIMSQEVTGLRSEC